MARSINQTLNKIIQFQEDSLIFQPDSSNSVKVDKIIIQHSSGTPALSSSLYLWGIEQKLAHRAIEFVYISGV